VDLEVRDGEGRETVRRNAVPVDDEAQAVELTIELPPAKAAEPR